MPGKTERYYFVEFVFKYEDDYTEQTIGEIGYLFPIPIQPNNIDHHAVDGIRFGETVFFREQGAPKPLPMDPGRIAAWDKRDEKEHVPTSWEFRQTRSLSRRIAAIAWRHAGRFVPVKVIFGEEDEDGHLVVNHGGTPSI